LWIDFVKQNHTIAIMKARAVVHRPWSRALFVKDFPAYGPPGIDGCSGCATDPPRLHEWRQPNFPLHPTAGVGSWIWAT